jgi:hypothetical protein
LNALLPEETPGQFSLKSIALKSLNTSKSALIGHTGLVGGNLARQHAFDDFFNSSNIREIIGKHYDLLVCSGVSGTKWMANLHPAEDKEKIDLLMDHLRSVTADRFILISTVDVFGNPNKVDEDSVVDLDCQTSYGKHRHQLEMTIVEHFPSVTIVRLPAIYGWGLNKNALFDLIHNHEVEKINAHAVYQFYSLDRLWHDIEICLAHEFPLVNVATEPLGIDVVAREVFHVELTNGASENAARYDFRTKYGAFFGGANGYFHDKATAMSDIAAFVEQQRLSRAS